MRDRLGALVILAAAGCGGGGGGDAADADPGAADARLDGDGAPVVDAPPGQPDAGPPPASCTPPPARGNVFYVAVDGDDGAGDGSEGDPWATIEHAVESVPDNSTILVGPGTYSGRVELRPEFAVGVTVRADPPYRARLRHDSTVVTCFTCKGITLDGFDIAHSGAGAGALVVQIQDLIGPAGGADAVSRVVIRNNILHDSFNNDILKINNGARDVVVERNVFYNQQGSDEHIDINSVANVVVQDNIFFNDFAASGRDPDSGTSSFIVVKDSNGSDDSYVGAESVTIRRNVFFNWEGNAGANFVLLGEDGNPYFEADGVTVENNLFAGTTGNDIRATFGVKGCRDVTFRHNTVVGDIPGNAYAFRLNQEGSNLANEQLRFYNNIWSDWTGTMGDFSDTPPGETARFELDTNLYWNGGSAVPEDGTDLVNPSDDEAGVVADPLLPEVAGATPPVWNESAEQFADGSGDICAAFEALVTTYAIPSAGSPAIGAARPDQAPAEDIRGRPRNASPTLGAYEP